MQHVLFGHDTSLLPSHWKSQPNITKQRRHTSSKQYRWVGSVDIGHFGETHMLTMFADVQDLQ